MAWPRGTRKFKAAEHWPQMFVYFTQSLRDKVSGGQVRGWRQIPSSPLPRGHHSRSVTHPSYAHPYNHWIPAPKRDPHLVFPAYRGNTNNPKALGKASGLGSCSCFSEVCGRHCCSSSTRPAGRVWHGGTPKRVGTSLVMQPNHQTLQQLLQTNG